MAVGGQLGQARRRLHLESRRRADRRARCSACSSRCCITHAPDRPASRTRSLRCSRRAPAARRNGAHAHLAAPWNTALSAEESTVARALGAASPHVAHARLRQLAEPSGRSCSDAASDRLPRAADRCAARQLGADMHGACALRLAVAAVLVMPLLLALRGVVQGRRARCRRLAYCSSPTSAGLSVEVVARSRAHLQASR